MLRGSSHLENGHPYRLSDPTGLSDPNALSDPGGLAAEFTVETGKTFGKFTSPGDTQPPYPERRSGHTPAVVGAPSIRGYPDPDQIDVVWNPDGTHWNS